MNALRTNYATSPNLNPQDLVAISQQIMAANLSVGKGVKGGLAMSIGTGLAVNVSAGEFAAQIDQTVASPFSVAVPASYDGYLWIQGPPTPTGAPDDMHEPDATDPGATYVCLGHFVTSGSAVTSVDAAGRQTYGQASFAANVLAAPAAPFSGTVTAAGGFGSSTFSVASGNHTLTTTEAASLILLVTGASGASRNVVAPATLGKPFLAFNQSNNSVVVKTPSGTGVTIATGKAAWVVCDGTNYLRGTADA